MNPRGGTEILWNNFQKYVNGDLSNRANLICSNANPSLLHPTKPNILWQHVDTNQDVAQGLRNPGYQLKLHKIVFVSNWQRNKYNNEFGLSDILSTVILNAIEPVEFIPKEKPSKLKLIYTSTPWRGLEVLVEAFKLLNRSDIELDVYSSTVIYGAHFMPNGYQWLFDRCRTTPGIKYKGYVTNKAIIKALQRAHIFAYPSIFAETSCLAAIEAGAAGCRIVTTDLGALTETCGHWASYVPVDKNLVENYANLLNNEIDNYWNNYDERIEQSKYFNNRYSWLLRKTEWENLLGEI